MVALMSEMKAMTATPLASYSHEWKHVPQALVPIQASKAASSPPVDMIRFRRLIFSSRWPGSRLKDSTTLE